MVNSVFAQEWWCIKWIVTTDCAGSKNVEISVDQIGQNTKNESFPHKISSTYYL